MRILIADDEPATRAVVRRVLMRHFPCEVTEVDNGLDALDRLAQTPHSLVLLDVRMALMNGVETLRAIRGHARTAHLPVIMMTGSTDEQIVREIVSLGVSDYVLKPVRPGVIVERVARIAADLNPAKTPQARTPRPSGAPIRLTPASRILLVDGNQDFAYLFREVVGTQARLYETASGIDALRMHLTEPFDAVFVGSDLGMFGHEDLTQKLRHSGSGHRLSVVRVLPPGVAPKRRDADLYDAVIPRTFVAATLRTALAGLTGTAAASRALATMMPSLRMLALAAIEDVAAQALGSAVLITDAPSSIPPAGLEATGRITLNHPELRGLELSVLVSRRSASALTGRFRKVAVEALEPEEATVGVVGVASLLAERIAGALSSEGYGAQTASGITVESSSWSPGRGGHGMAMQVLTRPAGVTFRLTLRGLTASERAVA